jgi:hypothetical protein
MTAETLQASQLRHRDYVAAVEDYYRRGWTDGLPVIPPEPAPVAAFLDAGGVTAREVVGAVPTRDVIVTAEDVAINAVMAGSPTGRPSGSAGRKGSCSWPPGGRATRSPPSCRRMSDWP